MPGNFKGTDPTGRMESTDRILDAAVARFAEGGMRAVSIREVARVAEIDPSAIQYRFGTKANLWNAALERAVARDLERIVAETTAGA